MRERDSVRERDRDRDIEKRQRERERTDLDALADGLDGLAVAVLRLRKGRCS